MATLYFRWDGVTGDGSWGATTDYWFTDAAGTIPAGAFPTTGDDVWIAGSNMSTAALGLTLHNLDTSLCTGSGDSSGTWSQGGGGIVLTGSLVLGAKGSGVNHSYYAGNGPIAGNATVNGTGSQFNLQSNVAGTLTLNDTASYSGLGNIGNLIVNDTATVGGGTCTVTGTATFNGGRLASSASLTSALTVVNSTDFAPVSVGSVTIVGPVFLLGTSPAPGATISGQYATITQAQAVYVARLLGLSGFGFIT